LTKKINIKTLVIFLLALGLAALPGCDSSMPKPPAGQSVESLTLGTSRVDLSSLIWIAKDRGYFTDQGLDINFKFYESGHLAVKGLLAGHLDLATASEFAAVRSFTERADLRIISVLDRSEDQRLVARKDRGVSQASDLRGKRIGLAKGSSSEYYLHVMSALDQIPLQELEIVDVLPSEQVKAITKGDIDAALVWEPFATAAKRDLGTNGVSWSGQSGLRDYWLLLSTSEVVGKRAGAIRQFLTALVLAEDFIKMNNPEAKRIVANELGDKFEDSLWPNHRFKLDLDRSLLLKMEAEIIWLKAQQESQFFNVSDLQELIHFDSLKSVRPEKIELLH